MRVVIYTRVRTAEEADNSSLATQEHDCRRFCERKGYEVVAVFREDGASAIDDYQLLRGPLRAFGIHVLAAQESFDDTATGRFLETMLAAVAQLDNDQRADRTRADMKAAAAAGRWIWRTPLGYRRGTRQPAPSPLVDPVQGPLVRMASEQYSSGLASKQEVPRHVTTLGLGRDGRPLSAQSFGNMLRNTVYKGWVVSPRLGVSVCGDFEAIVPADIFDRTQTVTNEPKPSLKRQGDHPDFPLRRVTRCARCDSLLTGSWSKGRSSRYAYYRCRRAGCSTGSVPRTQVHDHFASYLQSVQARQGVFALLGTVIRDEWQKVNSVLEESHDRSERVRTELLKRREALVQAYVYEKAIDP